MEKIILLTAIAVTLGVVFCRSRGRVDILSADSGAG
jgi:hypothetical protein